MQKQKTIAKWLIIIILCTIMVGGYLVYDAIVNNNGNTALGENGNPAFKITAEKEKYHTVLPRESEQIDGIDVSHVGGENDESIKKIIAYNGKFFVFFQSNSCEYDVEKSGLNMAYFEGLTLEKVLWITDAEFVDCKLMSAGICLLTKGEKNCAYLINAYGEIVAKTDAPDFDYCTLNLNANVLEAYFVNDDELHMATIQSNLDFAVSNFVLNVKNLTIKSILSTHNSSTLILENVSDNPCTKIVGYSHDKGFTIRYIADKTSFLRIFTLGDLETNFILCGKSQGRIILFSLDSDFKLTAKKTLDEDDGIIISNGTNLSVICNEFTYEFCRHLDLQSKRNSLVHDKIKEYNDRFFVVEKDGKDTLFTTDNRSIASFASCNNYRIIESGDTIYAFVETSSIEKVFRGNFGGYDIYFLAINNIDG